MEGHAGFSRFCSVSNILKLIDCILVAGLSIGGIIVGGLHFRDCNGSPFLPWWLLVHGSACALYYLFSIVTLLGIPFEVNRLISQVSTQERIIGTVLESLGLPQGRHFIRDESPVCSFQEVVCNNKDRFHHKLRWSELVFAAFGVFFVCSLMFGAFVVSLTAFGQNCHKGMQVYTVTLVITTVLLVLIKACRSLQDAE